MWRIWQNRPPKTDRALSNSGDLPSIAFSSNIGTYEIEWMLLELPGPRPRNRLIGCPQNRESAQMSVNAILVVVGTVLILVGLTKVGQSGGLSLSNIGINFGGTTTQNNKVGNVMPASTKGGKADWVGLGIAAIGL